MRHPEGADSGFREGMSGELDARPTENGTAGGARSATPHVISQE